MKCRITIAMCLALAPLIGHASGQDIVVNHPKDATIVFRYANDDAICERSDKIWRELQDLKVRVSTLESKIKMFEDSARQYERMSKEAGLNRLKLSDEKIDPRTDADMQWFMQKTANDLLELSSSNLAKRDEALARKNAAQDELTKILTQIKTLTPENEAIDHYVFSQEQKK